MRSEQETNRAIDLYADTVRRICMTHLKSYSDTEDIFQDVFLKYVLSSVDFENTEHEKAWFIRVTVNACKDLLKSFFHSRTIPLETYMEESGEPYKNLTLENRNILDMVLSLPEKYRDVVYLFYYEGYTAVEIAEILKKNVNTIYTLQSRAKQMLKDKMEGEK